MRFYLFIFLGLLLVGCSATPIMTNSEIGKTTLNDFDAKSTANGFGRWKFRNYYGYQVIGWNKVLALPYYAIFDSNDVLVEYIGTMAKEPNPDDYQVLVNAKNLAEENRQIEQNKALKKLEQEFTLAGRPLVCNDTQMCKKAFTLSQIYISENAGMKIQLATDSIIETYNSPDAVSMKATKIPDVGVTETITLQVFCPKKDWFDSDITALIQCRKSQISQLNGFSSYLIEKVPELRIQLQ